MTDISAAQPPGTPAFARPKQSILTASAEMKRRNAAEARFKAYGIAAITVSLVTLANTKTTWLSRSTSSSRMPME